MLHVVALYISFHPAAISCCCSVSLDKQMVMETTDNPSASADNHGAPGPRGSPLLDADPLQPRALEYLADWEIRELIVRLEAEQGRREQARWEEAERIRRQSPRPCFHLCAYCQRFLCSQISLNTNSTCTTSGMLIGTIPHSLECRIAVLVQVFFFTEVVNIANLISADDNTRLLVLSFYTLELHLQAFCFLLHLQPFQ